MTESKCPVCGCTKFYIKNPDDEYDTIEFVCEEGRPVFETEAEGEQANIDEETNTYCDKCSWHGRFEELK